MDLELTATQQAFARRVRAFADAEVAPRAQAIDEADEFPRDLIARCGELGLMGVTDPARRGAAPASTTSPTRSALESDGAGERHASRSSSR